MNKNFFAKKNIRTSKLILFISIFLLSNYTLGILVTNKFNSIFVMDECSLKIKFNLILAIMGMISCIVFYNTNKKEEIFLISLMYTVFGVDIVSSGTTGYLNDYRYEYYAILTSFIRAIIAYISVSNWNSMKHKILQNKFKSVFILSIISFICIGIEYIYMMPYNYETTLYYKYYNIVLMILYIFIGIKYFKKNILKNDYIYSLIGSSTLLFSMKSMYDYIYLMNPSKEIYLAGHSTIILAFIIYMLGLIIEIHKFTGINKILEEKSLLYTKIIDDNQYSNIIVCDENYYIEYKNKRAKISLDQVKLSKGISAEEGEKFDFESSFEKQVNLEEIESQLLSNNTYRKEIYLKDDDCILDLTIHLFVINNKKFKVLMVKDNSEEYKMHKALLEYEIMKKEENLRNEFFSNISHELKTPLNVIYSTKQLLDISTSKDDFEDIYIKYSDSLDINCKRMLRLIDNIVDMTKLGVGIKEPEYKNYDIVNVVEDMTLSVVNYAKTKKIEIIFDTEIEELNVKLDLNMLERIVLNLLSNAIKFSEEDSVVYVEVFCDKEWVGIKVIDNGIGIDPEIQHKIFDRFVQGDKSIRRRTEGSGIGLSIVKSFVELMNGKIYLESDGKSGTEFKVLLPNQKILENGSSTFNDYNVDEERIQLEFSDIYELFENEENLKVTN